MNWHQPADGIALYVHWPFCKAKCPYCDFNSHVRERVQQDEWRQALLAELRHWQERLPNRRLTSIFFGGGTPSLMEPETVAAIVAQAKSGWKPLDDVEVTLEANPTSVEAAKMQEFAFCGVNRVSMGVQALKDEDLKFLGREHSAAEALAAFDKVAAAVPRTSFDLIYARPGQSVKDWREELAIALRHTGNHVSAYQLTIEPQTPFYLRYNRGDFALPPEDNMAELFDVTNELCGAAGLARYEVSNHAAPGQECRHNLTYWQGGDWVGIGPGAHGRFLWKQDKRMASVTLKVPEKWLEQVNAQGHGVVDGMSESMQDFALEILMMGLRLEQGIDRAHFAARCGYMVEDVIDEDALAVLEAEGLMVNDTHLRATAKGLPVLNHLLYKLISA
ncbi:coproporphyrinogen III oxidase [bacterium]|nr:coproporphyrinogen III oxidase [bacterium]